MKIARHVEEWYDITITITDVLIASDVERMVKPHKSLALVEEFQT